MERRCEDCAYCRDDFEYDDFGNTFEYCKCILTNELLDCTEAEHCKDYEMHT